MTGGLLDLGAGAMLWLAFALLALTQFAHRRATGAAPVPPARAARIRLFAACLLIAALVLAIHGNGPGFGTLVWGSLATLAALLVALMLGWRASLLMPLARLTDRPGRLTPRCSHRSSE